MQKDKDDKQGTLPVTAGGDKDLPDEINRELAKSEQQGIIHYSMVAAKRFPRNEEQCEQRIMRACTLPEFAGNVDDLKKPSAYYSFPRGGHTVSGGSIRLARELNRIYGNMRVGSMIVNDSEDERTVMGFTWDMETNHWESAQDHFAKLIQRKVEGGTRWVVPDERDLRELTFRRAAILIRNCTFAQHPSYLIDRAVSICKQTVAGNTDEELAARIPKMLDAFSQIGIGPLQIAQFLRKTLETISANDLADLRGIYESIVSGQIGADEMTRMFGQPKPTMEPEPSGRAPLDETKLKPHADQTPSHSQETTAQETPKPEIKGRDITDNQRKSLFSALRQSKKTEKDLKGYLQRAYGIDSTKKIKQGEMFADVLEYAKMIPPKDEKDTQERVAKAQAAKDAENKDPAPKGNGDVDPEIQVKNEALVLIEGSTKENFDEVKFHVMHNCINRIRNLDNLLPITAALNNKRVSLGL